MKYLFTLLALCSSALAQLPQAKPAAPVKTEAGSAPALTEPEAKTLADLQTRASKLCVGECGQTQVGIVVNKLEAAKGEDAILAAALLLRDALRTVKADEEANRLVWQEYQAVLTAGRNRTKCFDCLPNTKTGQWEKSAPVANPAK